MTTVSSWSHLKTSEELEAALRRQIGHMRRSMTSYDDGARAEAERLAACAYIMLNDGRGKTKSLLGQLGLLDELAFVDTRNNTVVGIPLARVGVDGETPFFEPFFGDVSVYGQQVPPHLPKVFPRVPFADWWGREIYSYKGLVADRRRLVACLRDQDGGGHVDSKINDELYHRMMTQGHGGIRVIDGRPVLVMHCHGESEPAPSHPDGPTVRDAHWASMRQIAYEIDETLKAAGF